MGLKKRTQEITDKVRIWIQDLSLIPRLQSSLPSDLDQVLSPIWRVKESPSEVLSELADKVSFAREARDESSEVYIENQYLIAGRIYYGHYRSFLADYRRLTEQ